MTGIWGYEIGERFVADHCRGFACRQLIAVTTRQDITDIARPGPADGGNGPDDNFGMLGISKFRPKKLCQLSELQTFMGQKKTFCSIGNAPERN